MVGPHYHCRIEGAGTDGEHTFTLYKKGDGSGNALKYRKDKGKGSTLGYTCTEGFCLVLHIQGKIRVGWGIVWYCKDGQGQAFKSTTIEFTTNNFNSVTLDNYLRLKVFICSQYVYFMQP
jgi:hypothetical protein